jgi:hypothetical protein
VSLFGNSSKKNSSTTDNTLQNAQQTNNQGNLNNGDGAVTYNVTDHGAVAGGVVVSQAALAANLEATKNALASSSVVAGMSFDFGSKALDSNGYISGMALESVTGLSGSVIDKITDLATSVLVNGEKATRGALDLAKTSTTSEAASITELMLKAGVVLGSIVIIGAVVVRGSKK